MLRNVLDQRKEIQEVLFGSTKLEKQISEKLLLDKTIFVVLGARASGKSVFCKYLTSEQDPRVEIGPYGLSISHTVMGSGKSTKSFELHELFYEGRSTVFMKMPCLVSNVESPNDVMLQLRQCVHIREFLCSLKFQVRPILLIEYQKLEIERGYSFWQEIEIWNSKIKTHEQISIVFTKVPIDVTKEVIVAKMVSRLNEWGDFSLLSRPIDANKVAIFPNPIAGTEYYDQPLVLQSLKQLLDYCTDVHPPCMISITKDINSMYFYKIIENCQEQIRILYKQEIFPKLIDYCSSVVVRAVTCQEGNLETLESKITRLVSKTRETDLRSVISLIKQDFGIESTELFSILDIFEKCSFCAHKQYTLTEIERFVSEGTRRVLSNFSKIKAKPLHEIKDDYICVTGSFVELSWVKSICTGSYNLKDVTGVKVYALCSVIFDDQIELKGKNLIIIAPNFLTLGSPKIVLSGTDAKQHQETKALAGYDGLPGLPGGSGGNFMGFSLIKDGLEKLKIEAKGGKGGRGQNGGDGIDGAASGAENGLARMIRQMNLGTGQEDNNKIMEILEIYLGGCRNGNQKNLGNDTFITACDYQSKSCFCIPTYNITKYTIKARGRVGESGSDGGAGGCGGIDGYDGCIYTNHKALCYGSYSRKSSQEPTTYGCDGRGGEGGEGKINGRFFSAEFEIREKAIDDSGCFSIGAKILNFLTCVSAVDHRRIDEGSWNVWKFNHGGTAKNGITPTVSSETKPQHPQKVQAIDKRSAMGEFMDYFTNQWIFSDIQADGAYCHQDLIGEFVKLTDYYE